MTGSRSVRARASSVRDGATAGALDPGDAAHAATSNRAAHRPTTARPRCPVSVARGMTAPGTRMWRGRGVSTGVRSRVPHPSHRLGPADAGTAATMRRVAPGRCDRPRGSGSAARGPGLHRAGRGRVAGPVRLSAALRRRRIPRSRHATTDTPAAARPASTIRQAVERYRGRAGRRSSGGRGPASPAPPRPLDRGSSAWVVKRRLWGGAARLDAGPGEVEGGRRAPAAPAASNTNRALDPRAISRPWAEQAEAGHVGGAADPGCHEHLGRGPVSGAHPADRGGQRGVGCLCSLLAAPADQQPGSEPLGEDQHVARPRAALAQESIRVGGAQRPPGRISVRDRGSCGRRRGSRLLRGLWTRPLRGSPAERLRGSSSGNAAIDSAKRTRPPIANTSDSAFAAAISPNMNRVVDDRREEVHRTDDREVGRDEVGGGRRPAAGGQRSASAGGRSRGHPAPRERVRKEVRPELCGTAAARCQLGQTE